MIRRKKIVPAWTVGSTSMKRSSGQKRHQGRLKFGIQGQYRFASDDDWLPCALVNISVDGMALDGKKSFYVGDKIQVRFTLEKSLILIRVEITNLIGRKAGGRITQISDGDLSQIQLVLNRQLFAANARLG